MYRWRAATPTVASAASADQGRIHPAPPRRRILQRGEREHDADGEYSQALKNAERARFQMHDELGVIRVAQERRAGDETQGVRLASGHQRRAMDCAASICLATSSSEVWRISLP